MPKGKISALEYRLRAVRVFTTNFGQALEFYSNRVGLTVDTVNEIDGVALFATGAATMLLEAVDVVDDEAAELVGRFVGVSLAVDDIERTYAALQSKGVRFSGPPRAQAWGGIMAHFHDPDDNVLSLVQWDA